MEVHIQLIQQPWCLLFFVIRMMTFTLKLRKESSGDIAPTILCLMGLDIPKEMSGNALVEKREKAIGKN